jgi:hypothetical protein
MRIRDGQFIEALYVVFLAFCLVALSSCSYQARLADNVEKEAQAQPALAPGPELTSESSKAIQNAPNLTSEQRAKLEALLQSGAERMAKIREEIGQHSLLLVKSLVDPKVSEDKIKMTRQKIVNLEKERVELWGKNLDEAKKILGRRDRGDERLYRAFLTEEPVARKTRID